MGVLTRRNDDLSFISSLLLQFWFFVVFRSELEAKRDMVYTVELLRL